MDKEIIRLDPKPETIKKLFAQSGNMCAFPGCRNAIVNSHGVVVGEICHIVTANEGGKRFINNEEWTNDKRRSLENLILLCPEHHKEIDADEHTYTKEVLQEYKKQHEANFNTDKILNDLEEKFKNNVTESLGNHDIMLNYIAKTTNSIDAKIDLIIKSLTSSFDMDLSDYTQYVKSSISEKTIKELHSIIMNDFYPEYLLGVYRNVEAWIGPRGCDKNTSIINTVNPKDIANEMNTLLDNWNNLLKNREDMKFEDQCVELAKFHIRFLQIHPFYDGNGRVSRTILISQVHMLREQWIENPFTNKQRYYSAIELADNGNYQKLANIIKNGIEKY